MLPLVSHCGSTQSITSSSEEDRATVTVNMTENFMKFMKFGRVVSEIYERTVRADRQTTDTLIAIFRPPPGRNNDNDALSLMGGG